METLKPCPFCGWKATHYFCTANGLYRTNDETVVKMHGQAITHNMIACRECGISTKPYKTKRGASNAWQRRVGET